MLSTLNRLATRLDPSLILDDMGIDPDPWQRQLLRSRSDRIMLNCHRQAGKSTATAGLALHTALHLPGALVLVISPSQRQSDEGFRKIGAAYVALGKPVETIEDNSVTLALVNGSRVVSLPASEATIRGYSDPALIIADEASRIPDEVLSALGPMQLVSHGKQVWLSTPYGQRGLYYESWSAAGDDWERIEHRASWNPRIDPAFLERERRTFGPRWYSQEYECQFVATLDQVFDTEAVVGAFSSSAPPLFAE